jgi:cobalt/nickel transport system ATP-binding protein
MAIDMTDGEVILQLSDVVFGYPGAEPVLKELNFSLTRQQRIGLIAPNGSGKTTLFHIIMGLLKPLSGKVEIFGRPVREEKDFIDIRRRVGLLFQDADDQLFCPTVLEDVAFGPLNLGKSKAQAVKIARDTLSFLGLADFEDRLTHKLSGGEKKLVSLATVLAMDPEVLLLDEPINALDVETKARIVEILNALDITCIVISHEIDFLSQITNEIYTMTDGRILLDERIVVHAHKHAHPHGTLPHEHE